MELADCGAVDAQRRSKLAFPDSPKRIKKDAFSWYNKK
jgi:hypothetical protein